MKIKKPSLKSELNVAYNIRKIMEYATAEEQDMKYLHILARGKSPSGSGTIDRGKSSGLETIDRVEPSGLTDGESGSVIEGYRGNGCSDSTYIDYDEEDGESAMVYSNMYFDGCLIDHAELIGQEVEKSSFVDVVFSECNFSNTKFEDCYFHKCEFVNCKGVGAGLDNCRLNDVSIRNCNFAYANFHKASIKNFQFIDSDLSYGFLEESVLKDVEFDKLKLSHASLYRTMLKGVDLSKSEIDNVLLSSELTELKGVIVSPLQTAGLVKYLGVVVSL